MSTIKANTLLHSDGSTTTQPSIPALDQRMASAWVNFNGTGTVAINGAYNVSSITDISTGTYEVNFTTTMANANYAAVSITSTSRYNSSSGTFATTKFKTAIRNDAATYVDSGVTAIVMGGQS
jgi:hypothetical protein